MDLHAAITLQPDFSKTAMNLPTHRRFGLFCVSLMASFGVGFGQAPDPFSDLQFRYQVALAEAKSAGEADAKRLGEGYVSALSRLESEFQNAGKLDLLLKAKNEREQFLKSGRPGEDATPELAKLKAILEQNRKPLEDKMAASALDLSRKYLEQLDALQVELTKSGKIDLAVKVKGEADTVRARLAQPEKLTAVTPTNPTPTMPAGKKFATVPAISPNPVTGNPFRDGNWPAAMAMPQANYRFEGVHSMKGEKNRQLLLSPGSTFQGGEKAQWIVGNSQVVAKDVTFRKFLFRGDLGSVLHFENCRFEDVMIGKGGPWFGGAFMTRWQLKDCTVTGSFIDRWVIKHTGVQIIGGLFERVEFPSIEYESDQDPSEVANHDWATFSGVRFRKCTLPASVLSLAVNCEFDDCRFVDDTAPIEFKTPISRTLYVANCTDDLKKLSKNLVFDKKPIAERPAP